jgi:hypothetical protein
MYVGTMPIPNHIIELIELFLIYFVFKNNDNTPDVNRYVKHNPFIFIKSC